jgi:hypothetical protein
MVYGWSMGAQQAYHWVALFGDARWSASAIKLVARGKRWRRTTS